jgi:hypothetical protein
MSPLRGRDKCKHEHAKDLNGKRRFKDEAL